MTQGDTRPMSIAPYPASRLRRIRAHDWSRRLTREHGLTPDDLIWALILKEGKGVREPIAAMPGVFRLSPDEAVNAAKRARDLGIPLLALFPFTAEGDRSHDARMALSADNLMCRTAQMIKDAVPEIGLMADVALDPYTDHGHDGILENGQIVNDATVDMLVHQALVEARAGFDIVAPSDMMDGRVGAIRTALEKENLHNIQIMAYAAKYASAFYGPYREAIGSAGVLQGDKRTYQMDAGNSDEAISEIALDLAEGADSILIKPGLAYLDILYRAKETFRRPTFAYQVSGEYAMLTAAGQNGWIDADAARLEALLAFKRAGADGVITYYADWAAERIG